MSNHVRLLLEVTALVGLAWAGYVWARRDPRWLRWLGGAFSWLRRTRLGAGAALRSGVRRLSALARKAKQPALLARKLRDSRRPPPTECAHPIVLAHGFMAVDAFAWPGMRHEYFRGVRAELLAKGHRVHVSRVSPLAGVRRRAEQLAEQIAGIDAEKVNIIAHSMGGLDARYAISRLGLAGRVASLTTIGTPHRGTPLADTSLIVRELPFLARALKAQFGLDFEALHDLTTGRMATFNDEVLDVAGIRYWSYAGWVVGGVRDVHALLAPGYAYLTRCSGSNDGMVPAESQRWGEVLGDVHADHWAQIGWSRGLDAKSFYAALARLLAQAGL